MSTPIPSSPSGLNRIPESSPAQEKLSINQKCSRFIEQGMASLATELTLKSAYNYGKVFKAMAISYAGLAVVGLSTGVSYWAHQLANTPQSGLTTGMNPASSLLVLATGTAMLMAADKLNFAGMTITDQVVNSPRNDLRRVKTG